MRNSGWGLFLHLSQNILCSCNTNLHLGNNFKNVRNWRSLCQKNNVKTLLKLVLGILGRQFRTLFEIIAHFLFILPVDILLLAYRSFNIKITLIQFQSSGCFSSCGGLSCPSPPPSLRPSPSISPHVNILKSTFPIARLLVSLTCNITEYELELRKNLKEVNLTQKPLKKPLLYSSQSGCDG